MGVREVHQARLLIVDDEPELRRMLLSILRGDGYADVHEAATAAEKIALGAEGDPYDQFLNLAERRSAHEQSQ